MSLIFHPQPCIQCTFAEFHGWQKLVDIHECPYIRHVIHARSLYEGFVQFCTDSGYKVFNQRTFDKMLLEAGVEKIQVKRRKKHTMYFYSSDGIMQFQKRCS